MKKPTERAKPSMEIDDAIRADQKRTDNLLYEVRYASFGGGYGHSFKRRHSVQRYRSCRKFGGLRKA